MRPLPGLVEGRVPPPENLTGGRRDGVGEHRQNECLGVPESVAVVSGASEALGRDRPGLTSGTRLQDMKDRKPHRLLHLRVAIHFDVGV